MSPEASSTPRRENSSRVIAAGCAAGNWPTSLPRGQVPDLDLRLVGGRRIERIAVAGEQVAAVGREGDRRQAFQLARILDLPGQLARSPRSTSGSRPDASCCC